MTPKSEALEKLANFPSYKHELRVAYPVGLIDDIDLILKWYNMIKKDEQDFSEAELRNAERLVRTKIDSGEIYKLSGFGFVICSGSHGEFLNIGVWDVDTPYLPKNFLYEKGRKVDIKREGAFCAWEGIIFGHESQAWLKYLASKRTEQDKKNYLEDYLGLKDFLERGLK